MKVLLDAHISGRVVGAALARNGHDVRSIDSNIELEGLPNEDVLELAATEGRVLVTANVRDFEPLLTQWAGEGRMHSGVILVPSSVKNEAFGKLISGIEAKLASTPPELWCDRTEWLAKT